MPQSKDGTTATIPIRECIVVLITAFAIFYFLSLFTFVAEYGAEPHGWLKPELGNIAGNSGTHLASISLSTLGWIAYFLPLSLLYVGIALLVRKSRSISWWRLGISVPSFIILLLSLCVFCTTVVDAQANGLYGSGGQIGAQLYQLGSPWFSNVGLILVSVMLSLISSQVLMTFSWLTLFSRLARGTQRGAVLLWRFIHIAAITVASSISDLLKACWTAIRRAASPKRTGKPTALKAESKARKQSPPREMQAKPTIKILRPGTNATEVEKTPKREVSGTDKSDAGPARQPGSFDPDWLPNLALLDSSSRIEIQSISEVELNQTAKLLESKLNDFRIEAKVISILPGPVVTRFELDLAPGIRGRKVVDLSNDLARELAVPSVRVVPVIPGKPVIGIEVPNSKREIVRLGDILNSTEYANAKAPLTLALGSNVSGQPVFTDIERMPHLLIAGTTGSGKSVGINSMLLSLLFRCRPSEVKLLLIDPKMIELAVYADIPHLIAPVVTDPEDAHKALKWCIGEMEYRYRLMNAIGVRNLKGFNTKVANSDPMPNPLLAEEQANEAEDLQPLPLIVVVIDEFADLMISQGKSLEQLIARIAQKARAAGMHLVLATQRPSVDVITGLIKANIPSRISYQVAVQVDSRTILDQIGAEQLLGQGDMLHSAPGIRIPERVHGAFVSDAEVLSVVAAWKEHGTPDYVNDMFDESGELVSDSWGTLPDQTEEKDELYPNAVQFVTETRKASISSVQRKLRIGYNRAARIIESMEDDGVISEPDQKGTREVLLAAGSAR